MPMPERPDARKELLRAAPSRFHGSRPRSARRWRQALPSRRTPRPRGATVLPMPAPSIINPMIDRAETDCPSLATSTLAENCSARVTSLAAARACRPRLLTIPTSTEIIDPLISYSAARQAAGPAAHARYRYISRPPPRHGHGFGQGFLPRILASFTSMGRFTPPRSPHPAARPWTWRGWSACRRTCR